MMPSFWRPEQGEPWHDDVTREDLGVVRDYLMTVESMKENKSNDCHEPLLRILRSLILTVVALARHDISNL